MDDDYYSKLVKKEQYLYDRYVEKACLERAPTHGEDRLIKLFAEELVALDLRLLKLEDNRHNND